LCAINSPVQLEASLIVLDIFYERYEGMLKLGPRLVPIFGLVELSFNDLANLLLPVSSCPLAGFISAQRLSAL
jgi:hypothetical protein